MKLSINNHSIVDEINIKYKNRFKTNILILLVNKIIEYKVS
ncbi:protein of unknown function [Clostridium beijerinckii]|nr:protein of unknown function [Clostridium beijerinckii]